MSSVNPTALEDDPFERAGRGGRNILNYLGADRVDAVVHVGARYAPLAAQFGRTVGEIEMQDAGFPHPPPGEAGWLRLVEVGGKSVLVASGRVYLHQGYSAHQVSHCFRAAAFAGAKVAVSLSGATAVREGLVLGQPLLVADHVNFTGVNPLVHHAAPAWGPVTLEDGPVYSSRLRTLARSIEPRLEEVVLSGALGPHYSSPAEVRAHRAIGADVVSHSDVVEALAARHLGMEVLTVLAVTGVGSGVPGSTLLPSESAANLGATHGELLGNVLTQVIAQA